MNQSENLCRRGGEGQFAVELFTPGAEPVKEGSFHRSEHQDQAAVKAHNLKQEQWYYQPLVAASEVKADEGRQEKDSKTQAG